MEWKQRARDAKTLIANAFSLFHQMGVNTHANDAVPQEHLDKVTGYINTFKLIDPATVDCAIVIVKIHDKDKGTWNLVGGMCGHQLELDTLEMMIGGKLEAERAIQDEAKATVKH